MPKNLVILDGELARDPELRHVGQNKSAICNFTVLNETDGKYPRKSYIQCKAWGDLGERIATFKKGDYIELEGALEVESWTDKATDKKVYKTVVNVQKLTNAPRETATVKGAVADTGDDDDSIPF